MIFPLAEPSHGGVSQATPHTERAKVRGKRAEKPDPSEDK
jgi:hypothetical protein